MEVINQNARCESFPLPLHINVYQFDAKLLKTRLIQLTATIESWSVEKGVLYKYSLWMKNDSFLDLIVSYMVFLNFLKCNMQRKGIKSC